MSRRAVGAAAALAVVLALALANARAQPAAGALDCAPGQTVTITGDSAPPRAGLLLRFGGRAVGGGLSDGGGAYALPLAVGRERPGSYAVRVETRDDRALVAERICVVPGAGATPAPAAAATPPPAPTPAAEPARPTPARPASDFDRDGDGAVTCEDFDTQAAARAALDAGYTDLDRNRDGAPCEELPAGP